MNDVAALDLLSGDDGITSLRSILSDAQYNSADDDFLLALSGQSSMLGMMTAMDNTMDMPSASIDCLHISLYPALSPSPSPSPSPPLIDDTTVDDADTPDVETTTSPEPLNVAPTDDSGLQLSLLSPPFTPPPTACLSADSLCVDGGRSSRRRSSLLRAEHPDKEATVIIPPPIDLSTAVPTVDLRLPDQRRVRFVLSSRKRRRAKHSSVKPAHVAVRKVGPPISNQLQLPRYDDARPHIRFSKIRIFEFPKRADASKVPNTAAFAVGLNYDAIIQEREVTVDEFELTHINVDVTETDITERQAIWQETAQQHTISDTTSSATASTSLTQSSLSSASSADVPTSVSCEVVLTEVSDSLYASQSDVADLYAIRSSRRQVGCNCRAATRHHQICTETANFETDNIRVQPKRNKHHALTIITPTTTTLVTDTGAPSTLSTICSCVLAGIECNSNICSCTTSCCSNPNKRYSFDEKKVNSYRRRILKRLRKSTAYFTDEIDHKQQDNDTHMTVTNNNNNNITSVIIPTTDNNVDKLS